MVVIGQTLECLSASDCLNILGFFYVIPILNFIN